MKTPFFWIGTSFALGILIHRYMPGWAGGCLPAFLAGCASIWFFKGTKFFLPLFLVLLVFAGALRAHYDGIRPRNAVESSISKYRVELQGEVEGQPEVKKRGRRIIASFVLNAGTVRTGPRWRKAEKKVDGNVQVFWIQPGVIPEAGDMVLLFGRLEKPKGALNPGEFDYAKYLALKNIFAVIQPIGPRSGQLVEKASPWSPELWIGRARTRIGGLIDHFYPMPQSAILKALVVGVRGDVGPVIQNTFMKTGTVHLLAISGLNITMIAGSFFLIFIFLMFPRKITAALTMLIVMIYMPLAGFGFPIQRAGLMALMVLSAVLLGRPALLLNALCASFFLILWMEPKSLWNVGFQLSFASVLSLIIVLPVFSSRKILALSIGGSLAVLVGTSPIVLYYFNTFSPIGVIANLVAIPVFDAALFTTLFAMMFCWVPLLGDVLRGISSGLVTIGLSWIGGLSVWRFGYWFFAKPEAWQLWTYYGALGLILAIRRAKMPMKKAAAGVCLLCLVFAAVSMVRTDHSHQFRLTVLAGGREPILHIHFSNGADWLVNTGRNFPSDQGERLVLPYLRQLGIKQIDGILLTDLYKKHRGGLGAILRDVSVRRVLFSDSADMPDDFNGVIKKIKRKTCAVQQGARLDFGNETMTILNAGKRGMSLAIERGPQKILFISSLVLIDPETVNAMDPDIMILPFLKGPFSQDVLDAVLKKSRRVVFSGGDAGICYKHIRDDTGLFDLTKTGALAITAGSSGFFVFPHPNRLP